MRFIEGSVHKVLSFEQLLCDPSFQEWVFDPGDVGAAGWQRLTVYGVKGQFETIYRARRALMPTLSETGICKLTFQAHEWYMDMKEEIRKVYRKCLTEIGTIEHSFQVAENYCQQVQEQLGDYRIASPDMEQYFFKVIKPLFRSQADYFGLRYHAALFCAETVAEDQVAFWQRELMRLNRVKTEQALFYEYYVENNPDFDDEWFERDEAAGRGDRSAMDAQVSMYLALVKYQRYIQQLLDAETT